MINMDNFYIVIAEDFLEYETGILKIGGVQTYMYNLALLAQELGHKVIVFQLLQCSEKTTEYEGITVRFVNSKNNQKTFNALYDKYNTDNSIFVIATDMMNVSCKNKNVISINHGITFDIPGYEVPGFWKNNRFLQHVNKCLRCISNIRRFYQVPNTVCVDYNFYNWLRTFGTIYPDKRVKVIPNYASSFIEKEELIEKLTHRSDVIKIVFARRFVEHRGSRLFAYVIDELLEKYYIDGHLQAKDLMKSSYQNISKTIQESTLPYSWQRIVFNFINRMILRLSLLFFPRAHLFHYVKPWRQAVFA